MNSINSYYGVLWGFHRRRNHVPASDPNRQDRSCAPVCAGEFVWEGPGPSRSVSASGVTVWPAGNRAEDVRGVGAQTTKSFRVNSASSRMPSRARLASAPSRRSTTV